MQYLIIPLFLVLAYLLGSIPTSYIMGKKLKNIDIRNYGSGNVGATNALRVLGTKIGIITLIIDMGKGFLVVFLAKLLMQKFNFDNIDIALIFIGLAAIIGHIFTIFLSFKGGKGVATSAGVFIALTPIAFSIAFLCFIIIVWITKYVSLGSITAAVILSITELIINIRNYFDKLEFLIFVFIIAIFVIVRHKDNIKRLLAGNENKLNFKKQS